MLCHDSQEINFFVVLRKFKCYKGGYARLAFPEKLVLKENEKIKLLIDGKMGNYVFFARRSITEVCLSVYLFVLCCFFPGPYLPSDLRMSREGNGLQF